MALVAFDLDNTLGFFYHIAPVAEFLSPETVTCTIQRAAAGNEHLTLSPDVQAAMLVAEERFFEKVFKNGPLLRSLLRPNLDAMIGPVVQARLHGKVRAVILYSNTWNVLTMKLAKCIIETVYDCPGLFSALIDANHPIRLEDWSRVEAGEPLKTSHTLKRIFREVVGIKDAIRYRDMIFIDEREPPHSSMLQDVALGLTYLRPTFYAPRVPRTLKHAVRQLLFEALSESGLATNHAYLRSDVFNRWKLTYDLERVPIRNFIDLMRYVDDEVDDSDAAAAPFVDDSANLRRTLIHFFYRFKQ